MTESDSRRPLAHLLALLRVPARGGAGRSCPADALPRGNDAWSEVTTLAQSHDVLPLLARRVLGEPAGAVPGEIRAGLRQALQQSTADNLQRTAELGALVELAEARGLSLIPFKGPVLAFEAYGSLAAREFIDLDFLVRPGEVERARDLLMRRGYEPTIRVSRPQLPLLLRNRCELALYHPDADMLVELQWQIAPRYYGCPLDLDGIWARRRQIRLAGSDLPTLAPEDLLLVLCLHGAKHLFSRLKWIADVAYAAAAFEELDWQRLQEAARRIGCLRIVQLALVLARDLLGAPVPDRVLDPQRTRAVATLATEVRRSLEYAGTGQARGLAYVGLYTRMRERPAQRLGFVLGLALRSTVGDYEAVSLPRLLNFGYAFVRPTRLAAKYGKAILRGAGAA